MCVYSLYFLFIFISSFIPLLSDKKEIISPFFAFVKTYFAAWVVACFGLFYRGLRRMGVILQLKYSVELCYQFDLWPSLTAQSYWLFFLRGEKDNLDYLLVKGGYQIYYYCLRTQPFKLSSVCVVKLDTTFNVYVFIILISSWWIVPFSRIKWPSWPLMTNCDLKSSLP